MTDEVVIVGAGPAGMLLAWLLATRGVSVHVIERHADFKREFRGEGIQASVVRHLEELGLLDELLASGTAIPAQSATIFLDDRVVAELSGVGDQADFGIILHQERFLSFLHERLLQLPTYRATFGATVRDLVKDDADRTIGVVATTADKREIRIDSSLVVVATGRGTTLRKGAGLEARTVDTHFNILWMRLPAPADPSLVPSGFRAYLTGDSLFIVHPTDGGQLQMAWGRRDEHVLKDPDHASKKSFLLAEAPPPYRAFLDTHYQPTTRTQFLRVQCDRLTRWSAPGVLFVGDAAHTMSPVAGQGINLAMRDSIVVAHHLLALRDAGHPWDAVGPTIQAEREPEVRAMQTFQRRLGYFMLGAPRWQVRAFFGIALPVLTRLGIRRRLLRRVQAGVVDLEIDEVASTASRTAMRALPPAREAIEGARS